jgi:hypothetical protein
VQDVTTDAWDHGAYAAEINTNWVGFVGPGVKHLGLDGSGPAEGPNSAGPNSGQITVVQSHTIGTWVDETDIRPTMMYLTGLHDDYLQDGRVISQILTHTDHALRGRAVTPLGTGVPIGRTDCGPPRYRSKFSGCDARRRPRYRRCSPPRPRPHVRCARA